jgi:ribonuclease D
VQINKRFQRANWGERPLPVSMQDYARQDTRYLISLRDRLAAALEQRGLSALAQEDFNRLSSMRFSANGQALANERGADCWRVSGSHDLEPQQAAVLQELCQYRDQVARRANRPLFKVINDRTLLATATAAPRTVQELGRIPGMSPGQVRRHGHALLQAVQRGLKAQPLRPPRPPRPDDRYLARLDALRNWRKQAAQQMGVPSDVVLPRDVMLSLAENGPQSRAELDRLLEDFPWRREKFGSKIWDALSKAGEG